VLSCSGFSLGLTQDFVGFGFLRQAQVAAAQFSPDPLPLGFGPRRLLPRSSLGLRSLLLIFVALRSAKAVPFCCFGLLLELVCGFHGDCFGSTPKVFDKRCVR
jgi:hypothetical protein